MKSFEIEQRIRKQALEEGKAVGLEEGKAVGLEEGKAVGLAGGILDLLGALGEIPLPLQEKITTQKDETTLRTWLKLAAKAESVQEFEEQLSEQ